MIGPRLHLKQSQTLSMTPQLRQAIQLLGMGAQELDRFVEAELERNPLLDRAPPEGPIDPTAALAPAPDGPPQLAADAALRDADPAQALARGLDGGAENLFDGDGFQGAAGPGFAETPAAFARAGAAPGPDAPEIGERTAAAPSLLDHLSAQIGQMRAPPPVRALALALAGEIDEDGRLRADPDEAARRLGAPPDAAGAALALLQACEPTGIGARDLAECLALQLAERNRLDPGMRALLAHLPLLARADWRGLTRATGLDDADLRDAAAELRRLDPRPGRAFAPPPPAPAPPDVLVRPAPGGGWQVELNPETLPRLLVDRSYVARLTGARADPAARAFAADCAQSAAWLVRSLDQRARTILKVSVELVRRQDAFFAEGVSGLRPMTLRMVADAVGVHESTVSRVAAGKTLACPRGLFELRWFFTQAIAATDGGDAHSAAAIRARLRALIEAEDPRRTLSDDALVTRLRADGVDIARRTVAKYREGMNIPSSVDRRRLKALAAPA